MYNCEDRLGCKCSLLTTRALINVLGDLMASCFYLSAAKKSFYRYALFLSLVNMVQAIGSMLWYTAKSQHPHRGNAGIW